MFDSLPAVESIQSRIPFALAQSVIDVLSHGDRNTPRFHLKVQFKPRTPHVRGLYSRYHTTNKEHFGMHRETIALKN